MIDFPLIPSDFRRRKPTLSIICTTIKDNILSNNIALIKIIGHVMIKISPKIMLRKLHTGKIEFDAKIKMENCDCTKLIS